MIKSFALIIIIGYLFARVFESLRLPRIIGMILTGILIGPYFFNLLDNNTLLVSSELRKIALTIILLKAGLTLNISDLRKVGRPALLLSFLPASFEIIGFLIFGPLIFKMTISEALIIGSIVAAVSPAVVVPKMVYLIENGYGKDKTIPQMILAGASLDDVFVIVLFYSFLKLEGEGGFNFLSLLNIPVSIVSGVLLGVVMGVLVNYLFNKIKIPDTRQTVIVFGVALFLIYSETLLSAYISLSGLLAVMAFAMYLKAKNKKAVDFARDFGSIWTAFEVLLFVLVGACVNVNYALKYGLSTIALISICLIIRSIGTSLALVNTNLNIKERIFVVISYLPKATVQAAIGSIPLSMGLGCGELALSIAVVAILFSAPLGALLIDLTHKKFLNKAS